MHRKAVLVLFALLMLPQLAFALPADFSSLAIGLGGDLNANNATVAGVRADAYYLNGGAYTQASIGGVPVTLFVRNEGANDSGLGGCGPAEQTSGGCNQNNGSFTGGGGDINELSNETIGTTTLPELIRLTLPTGFRWTDVWVSSLDCNGTVGCSGTTIERGQLWFSNSDGLGTANLGTKLTDLTATSDIDATQMILLAGGAAQDAKYLYFIPGPANSNNDYLVWKADIQSVPEPTTGFLLLVGLTAAGVIRARRKVQD